MLDNEGSEEVGIRPQLLTGNSSKDIVSKAGHLSCLTDDREFMYVMKADDIYGYGRKES